MSVPRSIRRKEIRLKGYEYSSPGEYFVTICTKGREQLFGKISGDGMVLNSIGRTAIGCWNELPTHYPDIELDEFVVMPDHIHGIIRITDTPVVGVRHASPLRKQRNNLGDIVGSFKSAVTNRVNKIHNTPSVTIWQRGYFEHVIRDDRSLYKIRD